MKITGKIKKVIFEKPTGFAVVVMQVSGNKIKATGLLAGVDAGEEITAEGEWVTTKYGTQFNVTSWYRQMPSTAEKAVEFLASGLIPGIRRKTAEKIVAHLGEKAVQIIYEHGAKALEGVKGLGNKKETIARAVQEKYEINLVVSELVQLGISPATAIRIYQKLGVSAPEIVRRNPYALTEVELIGFTRADEIARKNGIPEDSPLRARAGILYLLTETLFNEGHTYITREQFIQKTQALRLTHQNVNLEAIESLTREKKIYQDNNIIGLTKALKIEEEIANDLRRLNSVKFPQKHYVQMLESISMSRHLTSEQKKAVLMAMSSGISVLTGGPGVGKTFTIKALVELYRHAYPGEKILLAAPTGRAAKRMEELIGHPAETVHRLLGWKKQEIESHEGIRDIVLPEHNRNNPLRCGLLVVDEVSMLDIFMARFLFGAVKTGTRVLLVGDPDQLPSVGPGAVLRDILVSSIPRVHLTEIFRQAGQSQIVVNSQRIKKGITKLETGRDFFLVAVADAKDAQTKIIEAVLNLSGHGEVQVLSPIRKGPCGTQELNRQLQELLNPFGGKEIVYGTKKFKIGDKVIQCKNDYMKKIMNGEIGVITEIDPRDDTMVVDFAKTTAVYRREDLKNLELAYAITVHKSQGSEYDYVVMPLLTEHYIMLYRSLLYTAVTRAKKGIVLVGQLKAIYMAIKRIQTQKRNTRLGEFLLDEENLFSFSAIEI